MTMTAEPSLAARRAQLTSELAALQGALPGMALRSARGDHSAADELTQAETRVAALTREIGRLDLARQEADRQAEATRRQAEANRRATLAARREQAGATRSRAYAEIETFLAKLAE